MKKLITLLVISTFVVSASSTVIACPKSTDKEKEEITNLESLKYKDLPAGYMVDGVYDSENSNLLNSDKANQNNKYNINEESILFSLNQMNKLNLTFDDVEIKLEDSKTIFDGVGLTAEVTAKSGSSKVTGKQTLTLNSAVSFSGLLSNRTIDDVYLKPESYKNIESLVKEANNKQALAALVFEAIGNKNPALEAFAGILVEQAKNILSEATISINKFTISKSPEKGAIFKKEKNIDFEIKFLEDNRTIIKSDNNSSKTKTMELTKSASTLETKNNYLQLRKEVFESLDESTKTAIGQEEFLNFSKVIKISESKFQINLVPGSSKMYSHDANLYIMSEKFMLSGAASNIVVNIK
ncbi:hypothetical protein SGLAD_v1c01310 [Spiroplasma gladiatoris]|uniref:Lipoprotein n=1 Tax=Spiroplasma gladiatoris TaxID=2143 RepID=A0A4P7AIK6_9MOLU|nr:hypothetical protein [Spiroplasma gladiatoris]QBQ07330.1 hypothetical protein SGLAD_v1c01310 [Spiroplasma gladiatoris]